MTFLFLEETVLKNSLFLFFASTADVKIFAELIFDDMKNVKNSASKTDDALLNASREEFFPEKSNNALFNLAPLYNFLQPHNT